MTQTLRAQIYADFNDKDVTRHCTGQNFGKAGRLKAITFDNV